MKWPLKIYRISGPSMLPSFRPGDLVLGWCWFRPRPGQVVVARAKLPLIKRIKAVTPNQIWLEGDNLVSSTDSRHFGPVSATKLEALILKKLKSS